MSREQQVVLASTSVRRRELLQAAGFDPVVISPAVDDGALTVRPDLAAKDCCALAWFKGAQVLNERERLLHAAPQARVIVAADTVCVLDHAVMGKPRDVEHAHRMLVAARERAVSVVTGVCIISVADRSRMMLADTAIVRIGAFTETQLAEHLASGSWRGRAGGFNIEELEELRWPVQCNGEKSTVVGLPMKLLAPLLRRLLVQGVAVK